MSAMPPPSEGGVSSILHILGTLLHAHTHTHHEKEQPEFCVVTKLDVRKIFTGLTTPLHWPKFLETQMLTHYLFVVANLLVVTSSAEWTISRTLHGSFNAKGSVLDDTSKPLIFSSVQNVDQINAKWLKSFEKWIMQKANCVWCAKLCSRHAVMCETIQAHKCIILGS